MRRTIINRSLLLVLIALILFKTPISAQSVTVIEYQEDHGVNRWAKLDGTKITFDVAELIQFASQPQWLVSKDNDHWDGPFPWLTYLGTDNNIWLTKVHASTNPTEKGVIRLSFESKKEADDSGNNPTFQIVDHNGVKRDVGFCGPVIDDGPKVKQIINIHEGIYPICLSATKIQ